MLLLIVLTTALVVVLYFCPIHIHKAVSSFLHSNMFNSLPSLLQNQSEDIGKHFLIDDLILMQPCRDFFFFAGFP